MVASFKITRIEASTSEERLLSDLSMPEMRRLISLAMGGLHNLRRKDGLTATEISLQNRLNEIRANDMDMY